MINPVVIDLNHANALNLGKVKAAGVWGIVHKATQGPGFRDPAYRSRRAAAEQLGFLWAAYNFSTGDDVAASVEAFFAAAQPGPATGMCLDFEDNAHSEMSGDQAWEFLDRVNQRLGRGAWIYGGNRIKEHIDHQAAKWIDMAQKVLLWQCRYIGTPTLSTKDLYDRIPPLPPWTSNFMIQFTGDGIGPRPHTVPGVEDGADLNAFNGTLIDMAKLWPGLSFAPAGNNTQQMS